jgi:hypothetical protein
VLLLKGQSKRDVVTQRQVLAPRILRHKAHAPTSLGRALQRVHVAQDCLEQAGLPRANATNDRDKLAGNGSKLGHIKHKVVLAVVLELGIALWRGKVATERGRGWWCE